MQSWLEGKCKDQKPISTIHKIRGILSKHNITVIESQWRHSSKSFYSVTLHVAGTSFRCNGKGVTAEFALASAYGELMERLQNFAPFRLRMDFSDETHAYGGFMYSPDEKEMSTEELLQSEGWFAKQNVSLYRRELGILELWKHISYEDVPSDFVGLPFTSMKDDSVTYIPVKMLNKMYMSNGMCAGNSKAEALIQGICEIFERFVNKSILSNHITPPSIPFEELYKYPVIRGMLEEIESSGQYKVILKDCSLGKGYPVVAVILIDIKSHHYFVKFGSFPKFELAVERTLTELLQGQELEKMKGMTSYIREIEGNEQENTMGILVNGIGVYPKSLFNTVPDYQWAPWSTFRGVDNEALLDELIDYIVEQGYNPYMRDVSFLDFPSYHVVIPAMSEVEPFDGADSLFQYVRYNKVKYYIRHLDSLTDAEYKMMVDLIQQQGYHLGQPVLKMIHVNLEANQVPWYYGNVGLLLLCIYLKMKDYTNAHKTLKRYIHDVMQKSYKNLPSYFQCLYEYLHLLSKGEDEQSIHSQLGVFFSTRLIEQVILSIQPAGLFTSEQVIKCHECEQCPYASDCNFPQTNGLYRKLKGLYAEKKNP